MTQTLDQIPDNSGMETMARPWGVRRMRPYPNTYTESYSSVDLDPTTQLGIYRAPGGEIVNMPKHSSSRGTETTPQSTNLDSRNDVDHDQDSIAD